MCLVTHTNAAGKVFEYDSVTRHPAPHCQSCTEFSVQKFGKKKAFEMAVALRRKKGKEIAEAAAEAECKRLAELKKRTEGLTLKKLLTPTIRLNETF